MNPHAHAGRRATQDMIRRAAYLILLVGLVLLAGLARFAHAEGGCPAGYEPWRVPIQSMADCMPIQGDDRPGPPVASSAPGPRWVSRWGAVAIGSTAAGGGVGVATDQRSRSKAESAAIKQCRETGGGKACKVFSYHDQCVAIAWGSRSYVVQSAESIALASRIALEECDGKTDACRIFYSACSLPQVAR